MWLLPLKLTLLLHCLTALCCWVWPLNWCKPWPIWVTPSRPLCKCIRAVNLGGRKKPFDLQPGQSALFDGLLPRAATWGEIDWLRAHSSLPLLLKGVSHIDDAHEAFKRGVAGLVVSNHGGRTLDTLAPTAELLPRLRAGLGPDALLLVDGGIRRGTDVLKAMALGANAVLLGRPYVHALAAAGALGVAHALRLLRDELEIAMALSGCKTLVDADPSLFF